MGSIGSLGALPRRIPLAISALILPWWPPSLSILLCWKAKSRSLFSVLPPLLEPKDILPPPPD